MITTERLQLLLRVADRALAHQIMVDDAAEATRLNFGAVWSANPAEEDAIYGKYTPYGEYTVNVAADRAEHFEEGKDYYFDISPAF